MYVYKMKSGGNVNKGDASAEGMNKRYVLSISYGNYLYGKGGTDKVILSHQKMFNSKGISYIHVCPFWGISRKILNKRKDVWQMTIDGTVYGMRTTIGIKKYLRDIVNNMGAVEGIFIHHLKDTSIAEVAEILSYCTVPIFFYLHDYMTICPTGGLVTEDGVFCGNGAPNILKCGNCSLFSGTEERTAQIRELLDRFSKNITFIAPSEIAKKIWSTDYPQYREQVVVIEHQVFEGIYSDNMEKISDDEPLKIAFVGYQKTLKGWNVWREATQKAKEHSTNEKFFQFGWGEEKLEWVEQIAVDFKQDLSAMINALRTYNIHCAVLWSTWPETYAYTYYEALAANVFVITNEFSGNICEQVKIRKNGTVAENVDKLTEVLVDERGLRKRINNFREEHIYGPAHLKENDEIVGLLHEQHWIPQDIEKENLFSRSYVSLLNIMYKIKKWVL